MYVTVTVKVERMTTLYTANLAPILVYIPLQASII